MKPTIRSSTGLRSLCAVHIALALATCAATNPVSPVVSKRIQVVLVALVFSQATLVAVWASFSEARGWLRVAGLLAAMIGFSLLLTFGERWADWQVWLLYLSMAAAATAPTTVALLAVRRWKAHLEKLPDERSYREEGLRYSLKHLMLLMLTFAVTLGLARWLRSTLGHAVLVAVVGVFAAAFTSVGLASIWAMLGRGGVLQRSSVTLVLAIVVGLLACYALDSEPRTYRFVTTAIALQAIFLLMSFLIVRLCGFRLVRNTASPSVPVIEPVSSSE